jgi:predicted metal-binding membrane protein
MARWRLRQVFALTLGLLVALGMSLSAVQAGDMAAKMAMASGMTGSGHGDCGGCDDGGSAKDMPCAPACMTPVSAAMLPQAWSVTVRQTSDLSTRPYLHRLGRAPAPDPTPPRPGDLG